MGQGLLIIKDPWSHSDTPHSVGLHRTSDQPVAETSTCQHTTITKDKYPCPQLDSNPQFQQAMACRPTLEIAVPLGSAHKIVLVLFYGNISATEQFKLICYGLTWKIVTGWWRWRCFFIKVYFVMWHTTDKKRGPDICSSRIHTSSALQSGLYSNLKPVGFSTFSSIIFYVKLRTSSDLLPYWPFTFYVCQLSAFSNTVLFAHSLALSTSISCTVFFRVRHFVKLFDRLYFVVGISGSSSWHQEAQIDLRHKNWIPKGRYTLAIPHWFMCQFFSYYACAKKKDGFQTDIIYIFF